MFIYIHYNIDNINNYNIKDKSQQIIKTNGQIKRIVRKRRIS